MNKFVNDFNTNVKTYYKELKKCTPITKSKELELIKKAKNNNLLARNELITANLKFVFNVAKSYKGMGVSIDDLISEGNLGLIKAIDKFDTTKDVKFISYAVWWVKQSIQEFLKRENLKGIYESSVDDNDSFKKTCDKSDDIYYDEEDECLCDDEYQMGYEQSNFKMDETHKKIISKLLSKLDGRAQFIIKSYYGIDKDEMSLDEIGAELNLSRERVRKIKEKTLRIMRSEIMLINDFGDIIP